MVIKKCIVCGKEFNAQHGAKICSKKCRKERKKQYQKKYRQDNKEYIQQYQKQYHKQYYQDNKEHLKQYSKQHYQDNKEHYSQLNRQHYQDNKEHYQQYHKQYQKQYYQDNKERKKQYYQDNQEHIQKYQYQYKKKKVNELIKQYDGNLDEMLKNIPSRWTLREAQMQVWFNESYCDGIIAKIESTPYCEVTGETDNLVVHHLYSFNTHPILGNDPSNMVRVHKDIHKEFHDKYGRGNNTPEQWEQFVKDYNKSVTTLDDFRD